MMPFETPITLEIKLPSNLLILRSEIVGESMYMGRTPIVWVPAETEGYYTADVYLGACIDPNMVWALRILLVDKRVNSSADSGTLWLHLPFQSQR